MDLICPFDGLTLHSDGKTARCSGQHSFDWAKEGYLNLLPVHAKQSKDPGDSPAMVQARRAFLARGYYDSLITAIARHCQPQMGTLVLLDAGCGEGTYLNRIAAHCQQYDPTATLYLCGLDISKHAIKAAAKTNRAITWLVASNRQIPCPEQSLGIVLCAFGFPVWPEFKRVLKPDGIVLLVDPGPNHLIELRRSLYPDVRVKTVDFTPPDGFHLIGSETVTYDLGAIGGPSLRDLIAMTPHQHRVPAATIEHVVTTGCPQLTVDVCLRRIKPT